jgi:hypothetical protein
VIIVPDVLELDMKPKSLRGVSPTVCDPALDRVA